MRHMPRTRIHLPVDQFHVRGGLLFAGVNGVPRTFFDKVFSNFLPRVGFAYQVNKRMVLRGGFGTYDISIGQPDILAYFQRLSQCPLFTVVASEQRGSFAARDLSQLPSIMLSTAMPETRAEPLARLQRLGGSFNENVTVNPFYFSAVREQNADIYVDIFFAAMWLRRERPRFPWIIVAFELPVGLYFITHLSLRFNTPAWAASAAAVSDRHYQSVADWLASN